MVRAPTYQTPYRTSLLASAMLILTLLQGTSFTLTLAVRSDFASDGLSLLVTLVWLFMYVMAVVGLVTSYGLNWATWLVRYRLPLTLLVAGAAFSTTWSVDAGLSLERSVHLVGSTLVALYLGYSMPLNHILRSSALILGLLMVLSTVSVFTSPSMALVEYEGQQAWAGVMASKNTLGFWSAISALLLVSLSFWTVPNYQRALYLVLAAFSIICLYNSISATSVLALLSASLVMLYLYTAFSLRLGMIPMLVLGILVALLLAMGFYYIDTAELIGRSGDLTGRGEVWTQTWQLILDRPLTGFGYGTLWFPTDESVWIQQSLTDFSWTVYHAHNGLLQIASELGIPLAILTLFMIVQQLIEILYCQYQRQQPGVLFVLGFTVALLVSNYSEARLLVNRELYWIFFIALPVSMLQQITVRVSQTASQADGLPGVAVTAGPFSSSTVRGRTFAGVPAALRNISAERYRHGREQLAQRRSLKQRLRKGRKITVINATSSDAAMPGSDTSIQLTENHETPLADASPQTAPQFGTYTLKRKLARRQRKAG